MAKQLEKSQWRAYFDRMSKALVGKRAEIEVASLKLGDQIEAEWLPLLGISYDPKDDIIEIALEGVDHLIPKPREVYVEENGLELSSLEVIDAEGTHQIIILKDPMMLPAPALRPSGRSPAGGSARLRRRSDSAASAGRGSASRR